MKKDELLLVYDKVALYPLFQVVYELSDDVIIVFDLSKRLIVDVNNQFYKTFNITKEQVFKDFSKFTNLFIDENELFNICDIFQEFGNIKDYEIFLKTKDNKQLAMVLSGQTQKVLGNNYVVCLLKDTTEKKNVKTILQTHKEQLRKEVQEETISVKYNEKRFRELYNNALVALMSTDVNEGVPIEVNNTAVNMFGYDSIEDFKENFNTYHHFIGLKGEKFLKKLGNSTNIETVHLCCLKKDGVKIWVDAELKLNKDGSIINWVLIDRSDKINQRTQNINQLDVIFPNLGEVDESEDF